MNSLWHLLVLDFSTRVLWSIFCWGGWLLPSSFGYTTKADIIIRRTLTKCKFWWKFRIINLNIFNLNIFCWYKKTKPVLFQLGNRWFDWIVIDVYIVIVEHNRCQSIARSLWGFVKWRHTSWCVSIWNCS